MYKCLKCGKYFKEPRVHEYEENIGEYWGMPAYQTFQEESCPYCGDEEFDEVGEDELDV